MYPLAIVYLFVGTCSLMTTLAYVIAARAIGAYIEEISVFGGPALARFQLRGTRCEIRLLPGLGGHVKLRTKGGEDFSKAYGELHPLLRILIFVAGSLTLVAVAMACLGMMDGMRSVWHGFRQVVRGALDPVGVGAPLLRSLLEIVRAHRYSTGLGIVAAKTAAFNLLPLLPLNGGQILYNLVQWRRRFSDRIAVGLTYVGLIATLILYSGWIWAIGRVLIHG